MQHKLSVGVLFKVNAEVGRRSSVGFFARPEIVDSDVLALRRMLFVVFLLRPFPLVGVVEYDFKFPVYVSQR